MPVSTFLVTRPRRNAQSLVASALDFGRDRVALRRHYRFAARSAGPDSRRDRASAPAAVFLQRFGSLYRTELLRRFHRPRAARPPLSPHDRANQTFTTVRKGPCEILRAPSWPKPREKGCFHSVRTALSLSRTSQGLNLAPSDSNVRCSANELLAIPNDARGPALHALLGTQCAAPSCLSPHRGYRTVISEHVPPCGSPRPGRLETRSTGGPVEHHPLLFGFHPSTFCVKRRGCKPAGPQHLPSVPVSAFRFNPRRGRRSEKPRIA